MVDVTCVGVLVADVVGKPIDRFPDRGKLALVERIELHAGGGVSNTGTALARLGISTAAVGKVGKDGFGDFLTHHLAAQGLDVSGIARDAQEATSSTMVLVHSDGERSFLHYLGANAALTLEDIDFQKIQQSRILHIAYAFLLPGLDGHPMVDLLKRSREAGVRTSLDTAWDAKNRWFSLIQSYLPYVDYFVPSWEEARKMAGDRDDPRDVAKFFLDHGVRIVGLKLGERGCYIRSAEGEEVQLPAFKVPAVDALGAGDAWVAGFLAGMVKQLDLERCAWLGNAVGASCVMSLGATSGVRGWEETLELIRQHGGPNFER
ncbi:carbohydrate kinase family protein [Chthonomonas calidirosea]|uniref:carbohydrate kinase family protein n=1 Tax=Chthonomonas calidirosea TaxID=454171 RepID=UPI0006EC5195|nr:carbohydrate kinase family protein [Chthonomonas calidirosea]CEK17944.1 sugar kinase, ribokinase [Chthonomonas calidirosea]